MKYLNLYYVYDKLECKCITNVIPASSHLTAALGFMNAYIKNKESKIPYKNLSLKCCGKLKVTENGEYIQDIGYDEFCLDGKDVVEYIRAQINENGLDDGFIDEEN